MEYGQVLWGLLCTDFSLVFSGNHLINRDFLVFLLKITIFQVFALACGYFLVPVCFFPVFFLSFLYNGLLPFRYSATSFSLLKPLHFLVSCTYLEHSNCTPFSRAKPVTSKSLYEDKKPYQKNNKYFQQYRYLREYKTHRCTAHPNRNFGKSSNSPGCMSAFLTIPYSRFNAVAATHCISA